MANDNGPVSGGASEEAAPNKGAPNVSLSCRESSANNSGGAVSARGSTTKGPKSKDEGP
jgi:hypothetical protein